MKEFLVSTFPNFTAEMYEGNAPCRTGGKMVDGGDSDLCEYTNIEGRGMPGCPCCSEKSRHELEPERIEKILNTKIENCKFWDLVQTRAKELYSQGVIE